MKKLFISLIITIIILSGCTSKSAPDLLDENIETFEVTKATQETVLDTHKPDNNEIPEETQSTETKKIKLEDMFAKIDFYLVSGFYSRNVVQEEVEFTEMFALDKTNFVRIAQNELEQEVFAYNYVSDDFTYIYYFDGEMMNKTVFNISTGAILQDEDGYAELLKADAEEIKIYFYELLEISGLSAEELKQQ